MRLLKMFKKEPTELDRLHDAIVIYEKAWRRLGKTMEDSANQIHLWTKKMESLLESIKEDKDA